MDKLIVTGISGFVGHNLLEYLSGQNEGVSVLGVDRCIPPFDTTKYCEQIDYSFKRIDLNDYQSVERILSDSRPEYIIHLASYSSVAESWKNPIQTFQNNTDIFLNLVTAIWTLGIHPRILSVGSSEEYGGRWNNPDDRISEDSQLNPSSPYAIARVSQEMLSQLFADKYGLDVVLTRSFNHIGLYQDTRFAIPGFIESILNQKNSGADKCILETGDISVIRDYVDIRDVIKAYFLLLRKGKRGEVYNVCSGCGTCLEEAINTIADIVGVRIETCVCAEKVRPSENKCIVGNPGKLEKLGWKREFTFRDSIETIVSEFYQNDSRIKIKTEDPV